MAEYAARGNGAAAARAAGYSPKCAKETASRLLTFVNVQAALDAHARAAQRLLGVTRDRVLAELQSAIENAKLLQQPMTEIAGWREIAKICGFYKDREGPTVTISVDGERLQARIRMMSDDDLLAAVEKGVI